MRCINCWTRLGAASLRKTSPSRVFNIGINVGGTAGQTLFHYHIHLIPRRQAMLQTRARIPRSLSASAGTSKPRAMGSG